MRSKAKEKNRPSLLMYRTKQETEKGLPKKKKLTSEETQLRGNVTTV